MRLARGLCLLVLLAACSRADEEHAGARRSPSLPPPPTVSLPAIDIPVTIDGAPAEPLTTAKLAALPPDFADTDRRAWRLTRVLPGFTRGAAVDAVSREDVAVTMKAPATEQDLQPVVFVTRRGDVVATLLDPADPFPDFHGQGGRLRRPGDTTPRVSPVVRLDVRRAAPAP